MQVRQEVTRLVACWKPDVMLLEVDAPGTNLRLQPLDRHQDSRKVRINPPIQERVRIEPVPRPVPVRLLDYLESVPPERRWRNLDSRIEKLAAWLKAFLSMDRRSQDVAVGAAAALQEATALVRELVDQEGEAIPGYGEVAVLLYEFVHEFVVKTGLTF